MSTVDLSKLAAWKKMQADAAQQIEILPASTFGGGGPTSTGMDAVEAKIAAAEARTDTKFAQVLGELRAIEKSTAGIKTTVVVTGIAAVALVVAIFGWGNQMFGTGMDVQSISDHSAKNALQQVQPKFDAIDAQFADLNAKIGTVLEAIQKTQPQPKQ
jgi:hypothetical protein